MISFRRRRAATLLAAAGALALLVGAEVVHAAGGKPAHKPAGRPEAGEAAAESAFASFLTRLRPDAEAAGVSAAVFDAAFRGMTPDPKVIALTTKQSEFSRPIWDYVAGAASPARVSKGRSAAEQWSSSLDRIESQYGVPRSVVLAVWGMESGFGANTGGMSVVRSLATLAFKRYRGDYFRGELIDALRIIQSGQITREAMKGSWAGAMGQTQFMPSSYAAYAVDGDGDGRADIWTSAPDALASTANFLRQKGWQPDEPWVLEVVLPGGLDLSAHKRPWSDWASAGVRRTDGEALDGSGDATIFLPAGIGGPAFLLGRNFQVIRAYNSSDAYALGVGYLANRIAGGAPLSRSWPSATATLSVSERKEVQQRLAGLGLYKGDADGRHGAGTRDAIRQYQLRAGLVSDGYADGAVLKALRAGK